MNIDSPDFVRRKVVYSNNNPYDLQSYREKSMPYQFGSERTLLFKHVAERLNSHDHDIEILQRFKKQATERKRRNFELKKKRSLQQIGQKVDHANYITYQSSAKITEFPKLPSIQLKTIQYPTNDEQIRHKSIIEDDQNHVNTFKQSQFVIKKLNDKLKQKEKKIVMKDAKLKKSQKIIELMSAKVDQLKREKQIAMKKEQLQIQRINVYMQQMNYKIAQNRAIFREEIHKLKNEIGLFPSLRNVDNNNTERLTNVSPGYSRVKANKVRNVVSQKFLYSPSRQQDINPLIKYSLPLQAASSEMIGINKSKSQIQNSLLLLKRNRNSLSRIIQAGNPEMD